jgi:hypothetical protein
MKKSCFITSIIFTFAISLACKCGWAGNFLHVAANEDLVVKVKILAFGKAHSDIDETVTVEVLNVFKGNETAKKITVWGDNGMLCRPYINIFKKDAVYYLALRKEEKDYAISVCGEYWLQVNNGKVKMAKNGDDKKDPKAMALKEFEKKLKMEIK